ncbi:MAG: glycosyltransferase family 39 protein [Pseudorhodoplanes sp.]|nr:glycosyltransferase family 39 protein [Pseudorhodoplanes sp.]
MLAILLMAGITALGAPTPDFGPAILSMPVWALALLHFYRAAGLGQPAAWYALAIDIGVLGLISYQGLMLAALLPLFALLSGRMAMIVRTMHPLIAGVLAVLILFPHLVWVDQVGNAKVPAFAALASREALVGTLTAWGWLAAILALSYAGLLILIVIATNATRVRRAQRHRHPSPGGRSVRAPVRLFLCARAAAAGDAGFRALRPDLAGGAQPALVLSALALVIAAGDNLALHHQRLLATAWALLLLLPPLLAAFAALITPWTGIELRITQPAPAMARYLAENFERRTGRPLTIVGGQTRLASLVAMFAPSRPSIFIDNNVTRTIRRDDIAEKGAVIVWPATDAAGTPPPDIKAQFPDLVPEVPRVFERMIEGRLMPFRIGWAMLRPRAPEGAPAQ